MHLAVWCNGTASASGAGGRGFDPRPGHSNEFENGFFGLASRLTGWCQSKRTSNTGNLPRKSRDITKELNIIIIKIITVILKITEPFPSYRRFLTPLQQTAFYKHSDKRRNCSKRAISPFATMFSTLSHQLSI